MVPDKWQVVITNQPNASKIEFIRPHFPPLYAYAWGARATLERTLESGERETEREEKRKEGERGRVEERLHRDSD